MKFTSLLTIIAVASFGLHGQNCDDLFISGYLEGASNDKAIEIYNPTASSISLDGYKIRKYTNGSTSPTTISFTSGATIAANDVYVIAHSSGAAGLLSVADQTTGSLTHNGNDAIALYNGTSNIDVIGVIGIDPGSSWTVGSGSTKDNLLKRKSSALTGVVSWNTSEWEIYDDESWSTLGSHTSGCYSDTRDFSADDYNYTNGGGFYASLGGIGLYANGSGNKEVFVSYELCTDETNTSSCGNTSRFIQVGDVLSFQMKGSQAIGEVGVILNSSPSFTQSYNSKNSNAALELYLSGHNNSWQIIHNGSNINTGFSTSSSQKTYDVTIELTSKSTAKVTINDGSSSASYYTTLSNSNVSHLTFYLKDDWDGINNSDFFFGSNGNDIKLENSGILTISNTGTYG
ncbi:MAG: lamin tail domain-containing protein, partial [Schleiferiaceae bacterium]|nr:lamin tail domain-containing protein [Schleiferiaceae bacterium]